VQTNNKIINYSQLSKIYNNFKKDNKTTVLVTGVFDLLHQGHIQFLQKAKKHGDLLLVGLESDERVMQMKGIDRPVENINERMNKVAKLNYVDFVFALPVNFDNMERERFIAVLKPDIFAVSSHTQYLAKKRDIMNKYGGKVVIVMQKDDRFSTTQIIRKQSINKSAK